MDVSIIIPVFNCRELTRTCLASLERTVTGSIHYEVILVDDGSTDGTQDLLRQLPASRYRVIFNPARRGYAANNNLAARLARGPILCLLNNDTVLLPGWLEPMLKLLRSKPDAGCVGNVQREPFTGLIDHHGVVFNSRGNPVHAGKDAAAPPEEPDDQWPAVTGACCLVRREVFLELGGFDESFRNGFEDTDFCLRASQRGYRHYVANESIIYHHISSSPGRHEQEGANMRLFRKRWGPTIVVWRYLQRRRQREREPSGSPHGFLHERSREVVARHTDMLCHWRCEEGLDTAHQQRQQIIEGRREGRRYLLKHLWQPWRYSLGRFCRALELALHPLPPRLPPPPERITFVGPDGAATHAWVDLVPGGFFNVEARDH